jgi:hypothetical protein
MDSVELRLLIFKHGVYEQCDDALFTNIGLEVEKNKTDNDTFFDAVIPNQRYL